MSKSAKAKSDVYRRERRMKAILQKETDPELLRGRAKQYIRLREWDSAIACLDQTLAEPDDLPPSAPDFVPNKHSLIIRGRVHLISNHMDAALNDAMTALEDLPLEDPIYPKAFALRADALYQMGRFEHALVIYHRGNRLRNCGSDDFRLGIQKATEAITNCLKYVKPKMKIDVHVEDTTQYIGRQSVDRVSYVFPRGATINSNGNNGNRHRDEFKPFCTTTSRPFQKDIAEMSRIAAKLKKTTRSKSVIAMTSEALHYAKERNSLWRKQDANNDLKDEEFDCEFHDGYLPHLNSVAL